MRVYVVLALLRVAEPNVACLDLSASVGMLKHESNIPLLGDTSPSILLDTEYVSFRSLDSFLKKAIKRTESVVVDLAKPDQLEPINSHFSLFDKTFSPVKVTRREGAIDMLAYEVQRAPRRGEEMKTEGLYRLQFAVNEPEAQAPSAFLGITKDLYTGLVDDGYYRIDDSAHHYDSAHHEYMDYDDIMSIQSNMYTSAAVERDLSFRKALSDVRLMLGGYTEPKQKPSPITWNNAKRLSDSSPDSMPSWSRIASISEFDNFVTVDEFQASRNAKTNKVYKKGWLDGTVLAKSMSRRDPTRLVFVDHGPPTDLKRMRLMNKRRWRSPKKIIKDVSVHILTRTNMGRKMLRIIENRQYKKDKVLAAQGAELLLVAIAGYEELARLHDEGIVMGKITKDSVLIQYDKEKVHYSVKFRDFRSAVRTKELPLIDAVHRRDMHNVPWTKEKDAFDWAAVIQSLQGTNTPKTAKWREQLMQTTEYFKLGSRLLNEWDQFQNTRPGRGDIIQSLVSKMLTQSSQRRYHYSPFQAAEMAVFLKKGLNMFNMLGIKDGMHILPVRHPESRKKPWPNPDFRTIIESSPYLISDSDELKSLLFL